MYGSEACCPRDQQWMDMDGIGQCKMVHNLPWFTQVWDGSISKGSHLGHSWEGGFNEDHWLTNSLAAKRWCMNKFDSYVYFYICNVSQWWRKKPELCWECCWGIPIVRDDGRWPHLYNHAAKVGSCSRAWFDPHFAKWLKPRFSGHPAATAEKTQRQLGQPDVWLRLVRRWSAWPSSGMILGIHRKLTSGPRGFMKRAWPAMTTAKMNHLLLGKSPLKDVGENLPSKLATPFHPFSTMILPVSFWVIPY